MILSSLIIFRIINMTNVGSGSISPEVTFGISACSVAILSVYFSTPWCYSCHCCGTSYFPPLGLPSISQPLPWYLVHDHQWFISVFLTKRIAGFTFCPSSDQHSQPFQ